MSKNKLPIKLIKKYQKTKSPIGSGHCHYYPTCSQYGLECYQKFNFFKASFLTLWRIIRCNPFSRGGYDPSPLTKSELKEQQEYLNLINSLPQDFLSNLIFHLDMHPKLELIDMQKLLFQITNGPSHLLNSNEVNRIALSIKSEADAITRPRRPFESIGHGYVRIDLASLSEDDCLRLAQQLIKTCKVNESPYSYLESLDYLKQVLHLDAFKSLKKEINDAESIPRHSKLYKENYDPHYRIIHASVIEPKFILNDLDKRINSLKQNNKYLIISVEGRSTIDKKPLRDYLEAVHHAFIINVNDFKKRKQSIDFTKIKKGIIKSFKTNQKIKYPNYQGQSLIVLFGTYSYHPILASSIDLLIYLESDQLTTLETHPIEKDYFLHQQFKLKDGINIPASFKF